MRVLLLLFCFFSLPGFAQRYELLDTAAFDSRVFTQGFLWRAPHFLISSGGYGRSFIAKMTEDNELLMPTTLPRSIFAEGMTELNGRVYLLSWREQQAFVLDAETFKPVQRFRYDGEGWGLTDDGTQLIMSDGTHRLRFYDPQNFSLLKTVEVRHNGRPLKHINELEYAQGSVWANIWQSDLIYRIAPESGEVLDVWDLSDLRTALGPLHREAVLNGIAWVEQQNAFWVTGKLWPKRFLVRFHSQPLDAAAASVP